MKVYELDELVVGVHYMLNIACPPQCAGLVMNSPKTRAVIHAGVILSELQDVGKNRVNIFNIVSFLRRIWIEEFI